MYLLADRIWADYAGSKPSSGVRLSVGNENVKDQTVLCLSSGFLKVQYLDT